MSTFKTFLYSFFITHLFFAVFIFFGLGIFVEMPEEMPGFMYEYIISLFIIATIVQSFFFTIVSKFFNVEGLSFFLIALVAELLIANSLFFGYFHYSSIDGLTSSLVINICLVAALFISMLIREHHPGTSLS
jgi:hypothetical protein